MTGRIDRALEVSPAPLLAAMVATSPLLTLMAERLVLGLELDASQWLGFTVVLIAARWLTISGEDR